MRSDPVLLKMHSQEQAISTPSGRYHCSKCGSPLSKSRPSSKRRRAHKRICGTIEGHKRVLPENSIVSVDEHCSDGFNSGSGSFGIGVSSKSEDQSFSDAVMEFSDSGFSSKTDMPFDNTGKSLCEVEKSPDDDFLMTTDLNVIQPINGYTHSYLMQNQSPENVSSFGSSQVGVPSLEHNSLAELGIDRESEDQVVGCRNDVKGPEYGIINPEAHNFTESKDGHHVVQCFPTSIEVECDSNRDKDSNSILESITEFEELAPGSDLDLMESLTPGHDPARLEDPSNSSGKNEIAAISESIVQCPMEYIVLKNGAERNEEERTLSGTAFPPCNAADESSLDHNLVEIGKEMPDSVERISEVEPRADSGLKKSSSDHFFEADYKDGFNLDKAFTELTPTIKTDVEDIDFVSDLPSKDDSPIILKGFEDYKIDPNVDSGDMIRVANDVPSSVSSFSPLASSISAQFKECKEKHIQACSDVENDGLEAAKSENPTANSEVTGTETSKFGDPSEDNFGKDVVADQIMGTRKFLGTEIWECDTDTISETDPTLLPKSASSSFEVMLTNDEITQETEPPYVDSVLDSDDIGNLQNLNDPENQEIRLDCGKSNQTENFALSQKRKDDIMGDNPMPSTITTKSGVLPIKHIEDPCSHGYHPSESGSNKIDAHAVDEKFTHACKAQSFATLVEPNRTIVSSKSPDVKETAVEEPEWVPSLTQKQRTPLKDFLGEAYLNTLGSMVPVRRDESLENDRGLKPDVGSISAARIGAMKEWESPGRYPAAIKREHKKVWGRYIAQMVCCASSQN